jgi:hypothetical protein
MYLKLLLLPIISFILHESLALKIPETQNLIVYMHSQDLAGASSFADFIIFIIFEHTSQHYHTVSRLLSCE